jgi:hypothetical protein
MKQLFASQASQHHDLIALARPEEPDTRFCVYNSYCYVRQQNGGNCLAGTEKGCQVFKFYERYGEDWNYLGV